MTNLAAAARTPADPHPASQGPAPQSPAPQPAVSHRSASSDDGPLANLITRSPTRHADALPRAAAGYRILRAWQRALDVAARAHQLAHTLPAAEQDALAADLRRAGAAVPAAIAAGNLAYDPGEHRRALVAAQTALARVETLALLAEHLELLPSTAVAALLGESADTLRLVRGLARVSGAVAVVSEPAPGERAPGSVTAPIARRTRRARRPEPLARDAAR